MPPRNNRAKDDQVKVFFQYCLKILEDPSVTQKLMKMTKQCVDAEEEPISAPLT